MVMSRYLVPVVAFLLLVALACGPAVQNTPTSSAPQGSPAAPSATPTSPLKAQELPTQVAGGGVVKVQAQVSDFMPAPDPATVAASQVIRLRVSSDISPGHGPRAPDIGRAANSDRQHLQPPHSHEVRFHRDRA